MVISAIKDPGPRFKPRPDYITIMWHPDSVNTVDIDYFQ